MMAAMLALSLRDWIVKGTFGPLAIGATQAELLRAVGRPDQTACPDRGVDMVWKYGDIELLFAPYAGTGRVFCVEMHAFDGVPTGGRRIRLDPWVVRDGLPLAELRRALDAAGVTVREALHPQDETVLQLFVRDAPKLHLDVIVSDRDGWTPGLHGIWMSET
jgi:hypothetical protein